MRIRAAGRINEQMICLGSPESAVYLLEGKDASMIISGGMRYIVPALLEQFKNFGIDEAKIRKLLILHAHFDHIGIVPFFKRRHPDIEVLASPRAWEVLRIPAAIATINSFGRTVTERMGMTESCATWDLDWRDDVTGNSISEGVRINLGGLEVHILDTPGHSSCSISAYMPAHGALFASDGGGIPYRNLAVASGNSNFTRFQESLEKLKKLKVSYHCADHYGYIVGEEADHFVEQTIESARQLREAMEGFYRKHRDIDSAVSELINSLFATDDEYFLSPEISAAIYRQMMRHIAKAIDTGS